MEYSSAISFAIFPLPFKFFSITKLHNSLLCMPSALWIELALIEHPIRVYFVEIWVIKACVIIEGHYAMVKQGSRIKAIIFPGSFENHFVGWGIKSTMAFFFIVFWVSASLVIFTFFISACISIYIFGYVLWTWLVLKSCFGRRFRRRLRLRLGVRMRLRFRIFE